MRLHPNKNSPREPVHLHVQKGGAEAKFWIGPEVRVAYNDAYDARTLRRLGDLRSDTSFAA